MLESMSLTNFPSYFTRTTLLVVVAVFITSCSVPPRFTNKNKISIFVNSKPQGAQVICGKTKGNTPGRFYVTGNNNKTVEGRYLLPACTFTWISGAVVNTRKKYIDPKESIIYSINKKGYQKGSDAVVRRPYTTGYKTDISFSHQLKKLKNTKKHQRTFSCHNNKASITCN